MRGKFAGWISSIMNSYRSKVERSIKEKKLAKHRQEKQGSNKYQNFLEETFKYPLSSSKAERSSEVKPSVGKFTESVVGELFTKLVDAEVQIGLENERNEALESEVNVLKRTQEALELTCQEKNVKLKRLRSSEHYQIEKNKKLEKQIWCDGEVISQVFGYPAWYNIVYDGDKSVYTYQLRTDLEAGGLIKK